VKKLEIKLQCKSVLDEMVNKLETKEIEKRLKLKFDIELKQ